ncbi:MAG: amidohydrolase family protein [Alphaproteobacteria bacterium]|nr:amidohydrolase family protein [Alphaproteobacteria bacterium]
MALIDARLLDPSSGLDAPGGLLVENGRIADLGPNINRDGLAEHFEVVDCGGHCLAPGFVDMRVQLREPGEEHKETIESGSRAAAAGGVTTIVCLPNTKPVIDDIAVVEFIARRAREVKLVKVFAYAAVTRGTEGADLTEMGLLAAAGIPAFTDGTKAIGSASLMNRALSYASTFGKMIIQHAEEPTLAVDGHMNRGEIATRLGLRGISPLAEILMIERDLRLVEATGGRYHVAHVSTADAVAAIRAGKARGLPVTCDTAPPYFTLNETAVGDYRTFAKLSPPLRSEDDRAAVVAGLADGTIDVIASDHAPQDQDSKRLPFAQAEFGAIGLETLLPLTLGLHHKGDVPLLDLMACVTCRPADLLGLPSGRLTKGAAADLVVFDPDQPWRVEEASFHSKSKNSPFEDHPVQGRVSRTIVDGRTVHARSD